MKDLHEQCPSLPILALSMHSEEQYAERALRAGASGYVMKREPAGVVVAALRKILSGKSAVSENMVLRLLDRRIHGARAAGSSPSETLSDRELEVYRCLGEGIGTREIASRLHLAVSTVESYRASIKRKMNLKNATELVSRAAQYVAGESER